MTLTMHQEALTEGGLKLFPLLKDKEFDCFYLAGGTALALQIGHRISVDFDFFSEKEIPPGLLSRVEQVFKGKNIKLTINNPEELTIFVDGIKITFLYYPFPLLEKLSEIEEVQMLSIKEIAATKAYTIGRRGVYKDYVDAYYILKEDYTTLKEIINLAEQKFGEKFNSRLFLEQLIFLDDIEDININFLKSAVSKDQVTAFFKQQIHELRLV